MKSIIGVLLLAGAALFAYAVGVIILSVAVFTYPLVHGMLIVSNKIIYVGKPIVFGLMAAQ